MARDAKDQCDISYSRAIESYEYEGAFHCLYQSYVRRGLIPGGRLAMRLTRHHLLPTTRVFLARLGRQVVGTLSLVEHSPLGLPMRTAFRSEIDDLLRIDSRLAEATCLAVRDAALNGCEIVNRLMGLVAQAANARGINRILIAVHPRHVPFYQRSAGFHAFTSVMPHPGVGGFPAVAMQLNLATIERERPELYRRYFAMRFPASAVSPGLIPTNYLRHIALLWRGLHCEAGDVDWEASPSGEEIAA